uniref:Uncharacterized protein n=1 Tax=Tetradesmus obliquus TaxID=3088 RepID=A0A383VKL6_TETOB
MGDFSKISGSYYRQTDDMMEPGKEREKDPNDLFSTATAIKSMNEQGGPDKQGMSSKGPAGPPASQPAAMHQQAAASEAHEQQVMQRNARNNT